MRKNIVQNPRHEVVTDRGAGGQDQGVGERDREVGQEHQEVDRDPGADTGEGLGRNLAAKV